MRLRIMIVAGALAATALTATPAATAGACGDLRIGPLVECVLCQVNPQPSCGNCPPTQLLECLPKHFQE